MVYLSLVVLIENSQLRVTSKASEQVISQLHLDLSTPWHDSPGIKSRPEWTILTGLLIPGANMHLHMCLLWQLVTWISLSHPMYK